MKMKLLIICALALATATALNVAKSDLKSRNIIVPAGRPEGRIVHGYKAKVGQFPYQAGLSIQRDNSYATCGASLLNHRKVLTAAHCVDGAINATVYLGSTQAKDIKVAHTVAGENIHIHPDWNSRLIQNDIAIIDIPYTPYTDNIQPIELPSPTSSVSAFDGKVAVASGWGRVSNAYNSIPDDLQYGYMRVMPQEMCRLFYGENILETTLCTATQGGASTCMGDSGGPLVLYGTKTQIGITSFVSGIGCEANAPAGFTRLASFLSWISQNDGSA